MEDQNKYLLPLITRYHNSLLRYARMQLRQEWMASMVAIEVWEQLYNSNKLYPGRHIRKLILQQLRLEVMEAKKAMDLRVLG